MVSFVFCFGSIFYVLLFVCVCVCVGVARGLACFLSSMKEALVMGEQSWVSEHTCTECKTGS